MSARRKRPHPRPTITSPRDTSPAGTGAQTYPTVSAVAPSLLDRARRLAEKLAITGAAVGLAAAASGCQPPSCQPTRLGEVKVHGETALADVVGLQLADAKEEAEVGLGIVPHPMPMVAGEMIAVTPWAPPAPPASTDP